MKQAVEAYRHVSATEKFMMLERMREDMRHNELAELNYARRENTKEIVRNMKKEGADVNFISKVTGLKVDDILRL